MAVKPETSVTPDAGIGEIAKVLRQFAVNNDSLFAELTSVMRDLRVSIRSDSLMNMGGSRSGGPDLTGREVSAILGSSPSLVSPAQPGVPRGREMPAAHGRLAQPSLDWDRIRDGSPPPAFAKGTTPQPSVLPTSWAAGRRQGLHGVHQAILGGAAKAVSNLGSGTDLRYEEVRVPASFEAAPGDILDETFFGGEEYAADNWQTKSVWRNANSLQVVEPSVAKSSMASAARAATIKRGITQWAQTGSLGQGVASALPAAGKALGVAGLVVGAAFEAQKKYAELVEQGRPYQGVLGGNTAEGVTESFREKLFSIGNRWAPGSLFNPVSERDSRTMYEGALGLYAGNRDMRNDAQSMMLTSLRSMGMRPEDSLAILQTAAKAGNDAIAQIATSLKEVTKSARDAGMNADEARKRFGEAYATISKSVTGAQGIVLAQAQAETLTAMGHRFEGVSLDNSSTSAMVWQSVLTGQNMGQVYATNNSTGGAMAAAKVSDQRRQMAAQRTGITADKAMAIVRREGWDQNALTNAQQQKIANEIMATTPGASAQVVLSAMTTVGGMNGLTIANAPVAAVRAALGADTEAARVAKRTGELIPQLESEAYPQMTGDPSLHQVNGVTKAQIKNPGPKLDPQVLATRLGITKEEAEDGLNAVTGTGKNAKAGGYGKIGAIARYIARMEQTGETDPVLERLIKSYDNSRRYRVKLKDGKEVAVGNFELITDFADQAGDAMIDKGQGQGLTTAEQLGIDPKSLPGYGQDAASAEDAALASKYGSSDKWKVNDKTATGTIVVRVGADLQKWIDFQATGGASVVYTSSGIPSSGATTADQRATG